MRVAASTADRDAVALAQGDFALEPTAAGVKIVVPYRDDGTKYLGILGKASTISKTRKTFGAQADEGDLEWFELSTGRFYAWFRAAAIGDEHGEETAREHLRQLDEKWPAVLDRLINGLMTAPLFRAGDRDRLSKRIGLMLKQILKHRGKSVDDIFRAEILGRRTRKRRRAK